MEAAAGQNTVIMSLCYDKTADFDRILYLFGYPIKHSLSPLLHQLVYAALNLNWAYTINEQKELGPCLQAMQHPNFHGAAVTMPYKVTIIPYLDRLTPEGCSIGAINTIFIREENGQRLTYGTNTDCVGIREAILRNARPELLAAAHGRPAMVIGGGGTSRAALFALNEFLGFDTIYIVNRCKSEVEIMMRECTASGLDTCLIHVPTEAQAKVLPGPGLVVSAIPDLPPTDEYERSVHKIVKMMLQKSDTGVLLEMCYHPSPNTAIYNSAVRAAWQVISGTEAMIWQGLEQDKYWTGREIQDMPVLEVKNAIAAQLTKARVHL